MIYRGVQSIRDPRSGGGVIRCRIDVIGEPDKGRFRRRGEVVLTKLYVFISTGKR